MPRLALCCSFLRKVVVCVSCALAFLCVLAPLALAQHSAGHIGGGVGGAVHTSAPAIAHAPIYHAPIAHAAVSHLVISPSRMSAVPPVAALGNSGLHFRPRPIRPPVFIYGFPFGGPFWGFGPEWGFNSCWWATCDLFWGLGYETLPFYEYSPANYGSPQIYANPVYVYGEESPDLPQLYLKDGTVYNVTDYWLVDDQLHFTMLAEDQAKPEEYAIGFDELDLQKTVDVNTQRGFRFVLRDEPVDQYMRDHPDSTPPAVPLPQK
jgi:hypothetical protein